MATDKDPTLIKHIIDDELWREYEWEVLIPIGQNSFLPGGRITYHIDEPKLLVIRPGGSTHRVVDKQGVVHCVPMIGTLGCVLRWKSREGQDPVSF